MQAMLDELGQAGRRSGPTTDVGPGSQTAPNDHAVLLMDRAGWHIAKHLVVPASLTPLFLPPLNAIERV